VNQLHEHHFRAMNTGVAAWLWADTPLADCWLRDVQCFFAAAEAELSRFRATSGLSRLNAAAGRGPRRVSPTVQHVLSQALAAARVSDGIFDPTVLHALQQAGYDRSFELLAVQDALPPAAGQRNGKPTRFNHGDEPVAPTSGWQQVILDPIDGTVTLPAGLGLDLGGIAKGWSVDRAAERLGVHGAALIDAGGDIRASAAPGGQPWPVAIADPFDDTRDLGVLYLGAGAVATSTVGRRYWQQEGRSMHHLIDPRRGQPCQSDLHTVTVLAPTAVQAEVAAKVALILGHKDGQAYLERQGWSGLFTGFDGVPRVIGGLAVEPAWEN
jgi:thiamine biosynthesis lipoprotein